MAQYGPLDDEYEYPWLNPSNSGLAGKSGVLGTPNVSWDGTNFIRNDTGLGSNSWFGKSGILPTAFQGLSALGGLMQAYTGFKGLELAKEQLNNAKDAFRTQWQNNVASTGLAAENAARVSYALSHTGDSYNRDDQIAHGQSVRKDVESRYKNYV